MAKRTQTKLCVAAIDFGTMYSGYAFSFRDTPHDIWSSQVWYAGTSQLASLKTPTCLLLKKDGSFDSFGYDAQNRYAEFAVTDNHTDYLYFHNFKMALHHTKTITKDMAIEDIRGVPYKAMDVFAMSIKYLKDHLLTAMQDKVTGFSLQDIQFVLTVPAIWRDSAKQFMRTAAIQAGITSHDLILALEPEAASIYCQNIPVDMTVDAIGLASLMTGDQYLVADLGGGTVDFTVHEKMDGGLLKEIFAATGGAQGGACVNQKYLDLLSEIVGESAMQELKNADMCNYFEIIRDFEIKKRAIKMENTSTIYTRLSVEMKEEAESKGTSIQERINNSQWTGRIKQSRDKLIFDHDVWKDLFRASIDSILKSASDIKRKHPKINTILTVGGYAECDLVRQRLRSEIPDCKIISPKDSGIAVLKGAVLFGHQPQVIHERKLRYTYGVRRKPKFENGIHPESHKVLDAENVLRCRRWFSTLLKINTTVNAAGVIINKRTIPTLKQQTNISTEVYCSSKENPVVTDDESCILLGTLRYSIPEYEGDGEDDRHVKQTFTFGLSELLVEVFVPGTGEKLESEFDLLE